MNRRRHLVGSGLRHRPRRSVRQHDPQRRLAAAVLARAYTDLRWLAAQRRRLQVLDFPDQTAALDEEGRRIVAWLLHPDNWASTLVDLDPAASTAWLGDLPAEWRPLRCESA